MGGEFLEKWRKRLVRGYRRVRQFFIVHPAQAAMVVALVLLILGRLGLGLIQSGANDVEKTRLSALPTVELSELAKDIDAGKVSKIVRHTLQTGTFLSPRTESFLEVVEKNKASRVIKENESTSAPVWKELVGLAFTHPFVMETGYRSDQADRLSGFMSILSFVFILILVMLFAQMMIGEVLSGKDFKVHRPDHDLMLKDVIGNEEVKSSMLEVIDQLRHAEAYAQQKVVAPKGILFTGDPGVGKTMLAKALANEMGADFFFATGADFAEMYVGVGPKRVRSLFRRARMSRLALIFIDEIDAIGSRNDMGNDSERRSTINALLSELDGMETNGRLLVVGATNHVGNLDPAVRRRGRFDRIVHIPLPSLATREAILKKYLTGVDVAPDVNLHTIALRSQGYSGAQLAGVASEAKNLALRQSGGRGKAFVVCQEHLYQAQEIELLGEAGRTAVGDELHRVAVHELGHALASHLRCPEAFVEKVSVRGRGAALGFTSAHPLEESLLISEPAYRGHLVMMLGGRAAESVFLGSVSNGASDDLKRATEMASTMVLDLGMGQRTGLLVRVRPSDPLTEAQEADIREILEAAYQEALDLVGRHRHWFLDRSALLLRLGMLGHDALFAHLSEDSLLEAQEFLSKEPVSPASCQPCVVAIRSAP